MSRGAWAELYHDSSQLSTVGPACCFLRAALTFSSFRVCVLPVYDPGRCSRLSGCSGRRSALGNGGPAICGAGGAPAHIRRGAVLYDPRDGSLLAYALHRNDNRLSRASRQVQP